MLDKSWKKYNISDNDMYITTQIEDNIYALLGAYCKQRTYRKYRRLK